QRGGEEGAAAQDCGRASTRAPTPSGEGPASPGSGCCGAVHPSRHPATEEAMSSFEVENPILNSPFAEPARHWYIQEGEEPELRDGRRPAVVFPPQNQRERWDEAD